MTLDLSDRLVNSEMSGNRYIMILLKNLLTKVGGDIEVTLVIPQVILQLYTLDIFNIVFITLLYSFKEVLAWTDLNACEIGASGQCVSDDIHLVWFVLDFVVVSLQQLYPY